MRVWAGEGTLLDLSLKNSIIAKKLTDKELKEIFDLSRYLKNIDFMYKKIGLQ